jgi:hypothetical protein
MKVILPTVLLIICAACASPPSPRAEAQSRTQSVVKALAAYHHDVGDYPPELSDLRGRYIATGFSFDNWDARHTWHIVYSRTDRNSYSLQFYTPPCSMALYTNGQFVAFYGPAFK